MLSAIASISSMLRPRKVSQPCMISINEPNAAEIINKVVSQAAVRTGREQSQRKENTPNIMRCVHLSMNGTFTLGISFDGVKHPAKISKVQSMAKNLAVFL